MAPGEAAGQVCSWLEQPPVQVLDPAVDHIRHTLKLLETLSTTGNLLGDSQMAAQAVDHDGVLHTADTDFVRPQALRWFDPIMGTGRASLRQTGSSQTLGKADKGCRAKLRLRKDRERGAL